MKKTLLISLLCLMPQTAFAVDRDWSTAKWVNHLAKGHFGSRFHFELEKNRKPYIPDVIAIAELRFGLLDRWQMNLELREDMVFYANSVALTNQIKLMEPEDSLYNLTVTAHLRYRFLVDSHSEWSGKVIINHGMLNDRLIFGSNVFLEAVNKEEQSYGASLHFTGRILPGWAMGAEEQLRLNAIKHQPDLLLGAVSHFNIKTEPIPIYYMYRGKRVWKSGQAIRAVDADVKFMKGVTDASPNWILSVGISLTL